MSRSPARGRHGRRRCAGEEQPARDQRQRRAEDERHLDVVTATVKPSAGTPRPARAAGARDARRIAVAGAQERERQPAGERRQRAEVLLERERDARRDPRGEQRRGGRCADEAVEREPASPGRRASPYHDGYGTLNDANSPTNTGRYAAQPSATAAASAEPANGARARTAGAVLAALTATRSTADRDDGLAEQREERGVQVERRPADTRCGSPGTAARRARCGRSA